MQDAVEQAKMSISEGASLAAPLAKSNLFPSMVTHMISLGEKSGELEPMLEIIAENYQDQVESKLSGLTSTRTNNDDLYGHSCRLHCFFRYSTINGN